MELCQMEKKFVNFFLHFRNLYKILNTLRKKMNLRGDLFLKLYTAKNVIT